ncbi:translation initiation factor IF-2-like [Panicum virgatum]|uniref:translation initiation factor IF-2-like n=1 Tax=Panicum virgatum TaxID=38727 RepID=UPI0019D63CA9|nr:translation initiation factor IF-2-like [Panicum virgatum]
MQAQEPGAGAVAVTAGGAGGAGASGTTAAAPSTPPQPDPAAATTAHCTAVTAGKQPAPDAALLEGFPAPVVLTPAWPSLGMPPADAPLAASAFRGQQGDAALASAVLTAKSEASAAQEQGLNPTYDYLRTWIKRQKPFPSFLQVQDDLVHEEITRGPTTGSSSSALVATPPASSASPATSLLGAPPTGQTGGAPLPLLPLPLEGQGGVSRPQQPAAMFTGAAPLFALSWTPPAQPSQPPTWPRGWDQAALALSFSTMGLTPPLSTEWIANSGASFHTTPDADDS